MSKCTCVCHNFPEGVVMHIVACCNPVPNYCAFSCDNVASRKICYDSNFYENDKYAWACEGCATKHEVK